MKEELKWVFRSPFFYLSTCVMFVGLLGYSVPSWFFSGEPIEYRESALALSIGGIFFGGLMLLMPFCAAVSHTVSQVEEIESGMLQWRVLRSSTFQYMRRKILSSMVSAACSTSLAFLLHALVFNLVALPVNPTQYTNHEIIFAPWCLYSEWYKTCYGLPMYISIASGIAISASAWAMVALAAAAWIPDRLLVVTIPSCLYYIWNCQFPYYIFGVFVPDPATLYNDALTVTSAAECLLAYAIVFLGSFSIYYFGIERRTKNA